jgi:hypothetical protein
MKDVTIFDGIDADSIENYKKKGLLQMNQPPYN